MEAKPFSVVGSVAAPAALSSEDIEFLRHEVSAFEAARGVNLVERDDAPATNDGCSGDCYGTCEGTVSCICGGSCKGTCVGSTK